MKNNEFLKKIEQIEKNVSVIKKQSILTVFKNVFEDSELKSSSTYNSNAIEGSAITAQETTDLLQTERLIASRSLLEQNEVVGYARAYDYTLMIRGEITEIDIKAINKMVLQGSNKISDEYRTEMVYIGNGFRVIHTPPLPPQLKELMKVYVKTLNLDINRLEHTGWLAKVKGMVDHHVEFESIHPFTDGNGRTGRLLLAYECMQYGIPPLVIDEKTKSSYYSGFKKYRSKSSYSDDLDSKYLVMGNVFADAIILGTQNYIDKYVAKEKHDIME